MPGAILDMVPETRPDDVSPPMSPIGPGLPQAVTRETSSVGLPELELPADEAAQRVLDLGMPRHRSDLACAGIRVQVVTCTAPLQVAA